MNLLKGVLSMIDISSLKIRKREKNPSVVKDVLNKPDSYKLEAFVENGEVVIKIKKREDKNLNKGS